MAENSVERLRKLAADYWKPFTTLVGGFVAACAALNIKPDLPKPFKIGQPFVVIAVTVAVWLLVRFPRVAFWLTRLILPAAPPPANPGTLFRGFRSYGKEDRGKLPGRQRDIQICQQAIDRHPCFVIDGEMGCGKTSLLEAELLPRWKEQRRAVLTRVGEDPFRKLFIALVPSVSLGSKEHVDAERVDWAIDQGVGGGAAQMAAAGGAASLLIAMDQFEELFVTVDERRRLEFAKYLLALLEKKRAAIVLGIRSDFLDLLLQLFREVDPELKVLHVGNYHSLRPFKEAEAVEVLKDILAPLAAGDPLRGDEIEHLAGHLAHELLRPTRDRRLSSEEVQTVLPADLQIMGWILESKGVKRLSVARIRASGGKAALERELLEDAKDYVWRRTGVRREVAVLVLQALISPAGTKWARSIEEIRQGGALAGVEVATLGKVLDALAERFLVKPLADGGAPLEKRKYELLHEHLITILAEAPEPSLQAARDARERLAFWLRRTQSVFSAPEEGRWTGRLRRWLAQPIPFTECLQLWRFAGEQSERVMLKRNLRGFGLRAGGALGLALGVFSGATVLMKSTAAYQEWSIRRTAPVALVAEKVEGWDHKNTEALVDWISALGELGYLDEAKHGVDGMKDSSSRGKVLATAAGRLAAVGLVDRAVSLLSTAIDYGWSEAHKAALKDVAQALGARPSDHKVVFDLAKRVRIEDRAKALRSVAEGLKRANADGHAVEEAIQSAFSASRKTQNIDDMIAVAQISNNLNFSGLAFEAAKEAFDLQVQSKFVQDGNLYQAAAEMIESVKSDHVGEILSLLQSAPRNPLVLAYGTLGFWNALVRSDYKWRLADLRRVVPGGPEERNTLLILATALYAAGFPNEAKDAISNVSVRNIGAGTWIPGDEIAKQWFSLVDAFVRSQRLRELKNQIPVYPWNANGYDEKDIVSDVSYMSSLSAGCVEPATRAYQFDKVTGQQLLVDCLKSSLPFLEKVKTAELRPIFFDMVSQIKDLFQRCVLLWMLKANPQENPVLEGMEKSCGPLPEITAYLSPKNGSPNSLFKDEIALQKIVGSFLVRRGRLGDALAMAIAVDGFNENISELILLCISSGEPALLMALRQKIEHLNKEELRSEFLAKLAIELIGRDRIEEALTLKQNLMFPGEVSWVNAAMAAWHARHGRYRQAAERASACTEPADQLRADAAILKAIAVARSPQLAQAMAQQESHDAGAP